MKSVHGPISGSTVLVLLCQVIIANVSLVWAFRGEWLSASVGIVALLLSCVPLISLRDRLLRRNSSLVFALLLAAHVLFGMFLGLYEVSVIYDKFMHLVGSAAVATLVYTTLQAHTERQPVQLPMPIQMLLVFCATLSAGTLWEVFEFSVDQTGLFYAQRGLSDTMMDLIADGIGAALAASILLSNRVRSVLSCAPSTRRLGA